MSHNIHEGIRNLSHVSSISLAFLFFYFITKKSLLGAENEQIFC